MVKPLLIIITLLGIAGCTGSNGCPCGQEYDRDPSDPEAAFYVSADHEASEHCYCRCGDGPEERFPPSLTCEGYEGACESSDGSITQLVCK